jgi:hypothetical protein
MHVFLKPIRQVIQGPAVVALDPSRVLHTRVFLCGTKLLEGRLVHRDTTRPPANFLDGVPADAADWDRDLFQQAGTNVGIDVWPLTSFRHELTRLALLVTNRQLVPGDVLIPGHLSSSFSGYRWSAVWPRGRIHRWPSSFTSRQTSSMTAGSNSGPASAPPICIPRNKALSHQDQGGGRCKYHLATKLAPRGTQGPGIRV